MENQIISTTDCTDKQQSEIDLARDDLDSLEISFDVDEYRCRVGKGLPRRIPGCGLYDGESAWVEIEDCARRGYSDYRWRVNRTIHGVVIHESGHHIQKQLTEKTEFGNGDIWSVFRPEETVSSYAGQSSKENFAECWRVYVTCPELLELYGPDRYEFFENFAESPRYGSWVQEIADLSGLIKHQIETASTNEIVRQKYGITEL